MICERCGLEKNFGMIIDINTENAYPRIFTIFICEKCIRDFIKENRFMMRFVPDFLKIIVKPFL